MGRDIRPGDPIRFLRELSCAFSQTPKSQPRKEPDFSLESTLIRERLREMVVRAMAGELGARRCRVGQGRPTRVPLVRLCVAEPLGVPRVDLPEEDPVRSQDVPAPATERARRSESPLDCDATYAHWRVLLHVFGNWNENFRALSWMESSRNTISFRENLK